MTQEQIDNIFTYHKPSGDQPERYERIRQQAKSLAESIQAQCPESREKSLAFTHLQEVVMWANAGIAINERTDKLKGDIQSDIDAVNAKALKPNPK